MDKLGNIKKMVVNGNRLELPQGDMFKNYAEVKSILTKAGGKYKKNGFEFAVDAQSIYARICGGEVVNDKKKYQFFATPDSLAKRVVDLAGIESRHVVLEPSAGQGALLKFINAEIVHAVELMKENVDVIHREFPHVNLICGDFLTVLGIQPYDRIVANPPFTKNQDIDHVKRMYEMLADGGRMVSIMSTSWVNGSQKKQQQFRDWLIKVGAEVIDVESGEFKESGTSIATKIVVINK